MAKTSSGCRCDSWARLYVMGSSVSTSDRKAYKEGIEAYRLLHKSELHVTALPVDDVRSPELRIGSEVYRGLREIKEAIKKYS